MDLEDLRCKLRIADSSPFRNGRTGEADIAKRILMDLNRTIIGPNGPVAPVATRNALYIYDVRRGVWVELNYDTFVAIALLYRMVPIKCPNGEKHLELSYNKIRGIYQCAIRDPDLLDPTFFSHQASGIAFPNGFVSVDGSGVTIKAHNPEHRALACMEYDYDPAAECTEWIEILREIFEGDPDAEEKRRALQEFAGACVAGIATDFQRCLVLVGGGENGKSTVAEVISEKLFPRDQVTHVAPQDWDREYNLSHLRNARINMASEVPEAKILASGSFKGVISGDPTTARNPYGKPFSFSPTAGHLFSCNTLPGSVDSTHGFWRRFLVLTFNRSFTHDAARKTKRGIKMLLDDEVPGIMLWAMHGAVRLYRQGGYTIPDSHGVSLAEWQADANPVVAFVADCCEKTNDYWHLGDIYMEFTQWCATTGRRAVSNKTLAKRLRDSGIPWRRGKYGRQFGILVKPRIEWQEWIN